MYYSFNMKSYVEVIRCSLTESPQAVMAVLAKMFASAASNAIFTGLKCIFRLFI